MQEKIDAEIRQLHIRNDNFIIGDIIERGMTTEEEDDENKQRKIELNEEGYEQKYNNSVNNTDENCSSEYFDRKNSFIADIPQTGFPVCTCDYIKQKEQQNEKDKNCFYDKSPLSLSSSDLFSSFAKSSSQYSLSHNFDENDLFIAGLSPSEIVKAQNEIKEKLSLESCEFLIKRAQKRKEQREKAKQEQNSLSVDTTCTNENNVFPSLSITFDGKTPAMAIDSHAAARLNWTNPIEIDEEEEKYQSENLRIGFLSGSGNVNLSCTKRMKLRDEILKLHKLRFDFRGKIRSDLYKNFCFVSNNRPESLQTDAPLKSCSFRLMDHYEGLHHHGRDPGKAGYTIPELLILCQSVCAFQQAIAIRIIACILRKAEISVLSCNASSLSAEFPSESSGISLFLQTEDHTRVKYSLSFLSGFGVGWSNWLSYILRDIKIQNILHHMIISSSVPSVRNLNILAAALDCFATIFSPSFLRLNSVTNFSVVDCFCRGTAEEKLCIPKFLLHPEVVFTKRRIDERKEKISDSEENGFCKKVNFFCVPLSFLISPAEEIFNGACRQKALTFEENGKKGSDGRSYETLYSDSSHEEGELNITDDAKMPNLLFVKTDEKTKLDQAEKVEEMEAPCALEEFVNKMNLLDTLAQILNSPEIECTSIETFCIRILIGMCKLGKAYVSRLVSHKKLNEWSKKMIDSLVIGSKENLKRRAAEGILAESKAFLSEEQNSTETTRTKYTLNRDRKGKEDDRKGSSKVDEMWLRCLFIVFLRYLWKNGGKFGGLVGNSLEESVSLILPLIRQSIMISFAENDHLRFFSCLDKAKTDAVKKIAVIQNDNKREPNEENLLEEIIKESELKNKEKEGNIAKKKKKFF